MKLAVFGVTGLVGGAVLRRALKAPAITSVIAVSRRELPEEVTKDPKLEVVILKDFSTYTDDIIARLRGCDACIWSIGGRSPKFADAKTAHLANVDYLHAAAKMLAGNVAPQLEGGKKFRFVYCSGAMTERDLSKKLYFMEESRKLKGEAETGLLEIENEHQDHFEVVIARPAGVLETDSGFQNILYASQGIGKGYLSYAMVDMALNGAPTQVTENIPLRTRGSELAKE